MMMLVHWTTGLLILTACVTSVFTSLSISVDISESPTVASENITVVCRLTGNTDEQTLFWYKYVRDLEGREIKELISTGDIISPLYERLGRFNAKVTPIGRTTLYILTLSLVTSEDSGYYGCYINGHEDVYDSELLEVHKPPSMVFFPNYTDDIIVLSEGRPLPVECHVIDTIPNPSVKIWLGNVDYTHQFSKEVQTEVRCHGSYGIKENCPLHSIYNIYLRQPQFIFPSTESLKTMRCEVTWSDSRFENVSKEISIVQHYKPKFECRRVHYTELHSKRYNISCHVTSSPSHDWWMWNFELEGVAYEVRSNRDPGYTISGIQAKEEKLNDTSSVLSLVISDVTPPYYDTVYTLQVSNSQGNTSIILQLREIEVVTTPEPAISKAVTSSYSVPQIFIIASLLLLLFT